MASDAQEQAALNALRRLRDAGHVAYFAGGCVRDRLLGLQPKDYDIATDAPPTRVRECFGRTQAVGQAFGVVLVHDFGLPIEVATFRTDGDYGDGRRPDSVAFADAEHDAQRRDFTINGLFYDPLDDRIIDYVEGRRDLATRVLRAIGAPEKRFAEDHLRMLRAVRFAARFGFVIEPQTAAAIVRDAPLLARISGERVADELRRMLAPPTRNAAYEHLWRLGLAPVVFRGAGPSLMGAEAFYETAFSIVHAMAGGPVPPAFALLCAAVDYRWQAGGRRRELLGNFADDELSKIVRGLRDSLKLSNDESDLMTDVGRWTHKLLTTPEPPVALSLRFLARPNAPSQICLLSALEKVGVAVERIRSLRIALDGLSGQDPAPPPLLTGDALVAAGHRPGPAFKKVLDDVYDAQLEGRVTTEAQALAFARGLMLGRRAR